VQALRRGPPSFREMPESLPGLDRNRPATGPQAIRNQCVRPWSDSLDTTRGSGCSGWRKASSCSAVISRFSGKGSSTKSFSRSGSPDRIDGAAARLAIGVTFLRFIPMLRKSLASRLLCHRFTPDYGTCGSKLLTTQRLSSANLISRSSSCGSSSASSRRMARAPSL
jgi:hypothetical protein